MRYATLFFSFMGLIHLTSPAWGLSFEPSVPPSLARLINADLDFVGRMQGSSASPMHLRIFGEVSGRSYLAWLNERVDKIGYEPASTHDRGATAYNDSKGGRRNHIVVTDWFARRDLPQIARVTILFHEGRHSEQPHSYWPHRKCPKPYLDRNGREIKSTYTGLPLAGEFACDSTPYGAYGVSVVMMMNIARGCRNCNEKILSDAALYAADQLKRMTKRSDRQKIFADVHQRRRLEPSPYDGSEELN